MPEAGPFDGQITFCATADLDAATHFYGELLGLPLALDQGGCRIWRVAPAAYLGFCTRSDAPRPEGVILTFLTPDVELWHARLVQLGVESIKDPAYHPDYQITHCFLRDPDGYLVEIQRFEDPAWQG